MAFAFLAGCQTTQPREPQQAWDTQRAALKHELAQAELRGGRNESAITLAGEALALSSHDPAHAELLARAYLAEGDFVSAENVLFAATGLHPNFGPAWYLLGTVHERQGDWASAAAAYARASACDPQSLDALIAWAQALSQGGRGADAVRVLDEGRQRFGTRPEYHVALAELYRQNADLSLACDAYRQALALGIADAGVRQSLGLALHALGRHGEAVEQLEPLVRDNGEPPVSVMAAYAGALLNTGAADRAADWLVRFTSQRPDAGPLWMLLARARAEQGETGEALTAARRAVRLMAGSGEAHCLLAALALDTGDPQTALSAAAVAVELAPEDTDALLLHGRALEQLGRPAEAIQLYDRAQRLDPQDELAAALLSRLTD